MKLDHLLIPHTKINSKWNKDSNVRHETIESIEQNIRNKLSNISRNSIFSDISPQARETKEKETNGTTSN